MDEWVVALLIILLVGLRPVVAGSGSTGLCRATFFSASLNRSSDSSQPSSRAACLNATIWLLSFSASSFRFIRHRPGLVKFLLKHGYQPVR